jgi:hypothetical protein
VNVSAFQPSLAVNGNIAGDDRQPFWVNYLNL